MMTLKEQGIEYKKINEQLIASIQCTIKKRDELRPIFEKLIQNCEDYINGSAIGIYYWVTGEEMTVKACLPVSQPVETNEIKSRILEGGDALSFVYKGPFDRERVNEYMTRISQYTGKHGIVIAEQRREIYLDSNDPVGNETEYQVIIHNWNNLLITNIGRVLGEKGKQEVLQGLTEPTIETSNDDRVKWIKTILERLKKVTDKDQMYDIVSRCAHVFPKEQISRLRNIYETTKNQSNDPLKAIDEVIKAMRETPLWFPEPFREDTIIYSEKTPYNPKAYKEAKNDAERRKAFCFCPLIREYLEEGIVPDSFCNCSAGWERQQWEGILQRPVKVDVVKSLLKGDITCSFAIHIPDEL
ncbi:MAG: GyrI-like domain-containing protein [Promethearchaeota archaeon]